MDEQANTIQFYNERADVWASLKSNPFFLEDEFVKFKGFLKDGDSVLDIGCAAGVHVPLFLGIGQKLQYTGMDASSELLSIARRRYPATNFFEGNILDFELPVNTSRFDGFWASAVLMHVPFESWDRLFDNLASLMKSGAHGFINMPSSHPSADPSSDSRYFTLLSQEQQSAHITDLGWKILDKGIRTGRTLGTEWCWHIVQLP